MMATIKLDSDGFARKTTLFALSTALLASRTGHMLWVGVPVGVTTAPELERSPFRGALFEG